ncbi:antitoxin Xre/MbcA/ParS toxin-binding domain-containing protein [Massilia sp. METH4]|uniref:antitoxin Xre/MbcA/ParS toxin-binding domain-containing protein n=1 Tax=Massilia sp. METH4 TaxID=3123041 RepID=UPI0030D6294E
MHAPHAQPAIFPYSYPKSRYEPAQPVDLNARPERERLSQTALKGFFKLAAAWKLRDEDARELLGGPSSSAFYEWKRNPVRVLEVDRITRISYLIGIYKSLHIIYGDQLADEWIHLPNKNIIFGGRSPLAYMLAGGLLAMQTVRKLVDARRGGL